MFLKYFIADVQVSCLIDTGSTVCVIHPRKYDELPKSARPEIKSSTKRICLADGSVIKTFGHVDLPIQIGTSITMQKFIIAEIDVPVVLGFDFLHRHRCTLDVH